VAIQKSWLHLSGNHDHPGKKVKHLSQQMYVENGKTAFTQGSVFQSPKPGGRVSAFHLFVKQMLPIAVEIELI
jgi:hypothetical protein